MDMELRIRMLPGAEFSVSGIVATDSLLQVKKRIHELKGFLVEQQMLSVSKHTERLPDSTKLSEIPSMGTSGKKMLKLQVLYKLIPLRIIRPQQFGGDLIVKTYPCCSIAGLKELIEKHAHIPAGDQTLSYNGVVMSNDRLLIDYNLKDPEDCANYSTIEEANATTTSRPFEINLFVRKGVLKGKLSLGIDFSFNTIKNVKKVGWKESAPWYREVTDGLAWFCYCRNVRCELANDLFIVNKGSTDRECVTSRFRPLLPSQGHKDDKVPNM